MDLFDFNGDGKTDGEELWLGCKIIEDSGKVLGKKRPVGERKKKDEACPLERVFFGCGLLTLGIYLFFTLLEAATTVAMILLCLFTFGTVLVVKKGHFRR